MTTLADLKAAHPEWCLTCGKWSLHFDGIHTCHDNPMLKSLIAKAREDEADLAAKDATIAELSGEIRRHEIRHKLDRHTIDRWVPCADHRDKTDGDCYVCRNETLRRQLTTERTAREEAERALEEADWAMKASMDSPWEWTARQESAHTAFRAREEARKKEVKG